MKNYKIISNLAQGSFGFVKKAIRLSNKEIVAVKEMKEKYESFK